MAENDFWIALWKLVAVVVCVLIATVGGCSIHKQSKVAELVKGGTDPIKASCGLGGVTSSNAAICAVSAK